MPFLEIEGQSRLFFRDWGQGHPVLFCAASSISTDAYQYQMLHLADHGRRMRESTIGTFAVLALILWALMMVAALQGLPRTRAVETLVIAVALGRWAAVLHAVALPPARTDGLGAAFNPSVLALVVATALVLATLALEPVPALGSLVGAGAAALATSAVAWRLLGARTGDTIGATGALTEMIVCTVLLAFAT